MEQTSLNFEDTSKQITLQTIFAQDWMLFDRFVSKSLFLAKIFGVVPTDQINLVEDFIDKVLGRAKYVSYKTFVKRSSEILPKGFFFTLNMELRYKKETHSIENKDTPKEVKTPSVATTKSIIEVPVADPVFMLADKGWLGIKQGTSSYEAYSIDGICGVQYYPDVLTVALHVCFGTHICSKNFSTAAAYNSETKILRSIIARD